MAQIADLSLWQIETTDLTELNVLRLAEGDPVTVRMDAIDDLELQAKITRIKALGENKQGDITYTVIVTPEDQVHDCAGI